MANSDGSLNKIIKIQKTKILPLRWFGNLCGEISTNSLHKAFKLDKQGIYGYRFNFYANVWKYINKPYQRWGTYYKIDIDKK